MKLPRDLSGPDLAKALQGLGYRVTRQTGEQEPGMHPVPVQQPARPQRLDVALELPPVLRIRRDRNARRRRVGL